MEQDAPNGHNYSQNFDRRMDRMEAFLQSMLGLIQMQADKDRIRHENIMDEIQELRSLEQEQRFNIMALFHSQKESKERLDNLEKGKPE